jgi:hypothetical protein
VLLLLPLLQVRHVMLLRLRLLRWRCVLHWRTASMCMQVEHSRPAGAAATAAKATQVLLQLLLLLVLLI